jgi:hypothetical protein
VELSNNDFDKATLIDDSTFNGSTNFDAAIEIFNNETSEGKHDTAENSDKQS